MTTEFIPADFLDKNIKARLKKSLEQTTILRGAVAFWTLKNEYFGEALTNALKHDKSFYCVDVSSPTNFDALLEIENEMDVSPFYVHQKRIEPDTGLRENLLHSKIIVMDKFDGSTEIWVGSHNFTNYALSGINIESSVLFTIAPNEKSDFKDKIVKFLLDIKKSCKEFNENTYYLFVALQDAAKTVWIKSYLSELFAIQLDSEIEFFKTIEIRGEDMDKLIGETIIILGKNKDELKELKKGGQKVLVHAIGANNQSFLYTAQMRASDEIDDKFSTDVEFKNRRIGEKKSSHVILGKKGDVSEMQLKNEGFYLNIQIVQRFSINESVYIFSHADFTKLWKSKTKSRNKKKSKGYEIIESYSFEVFQEFFLPKIIYKVVKDKFSSDIAEIGDSYKPYTYSDILLFEKRLKEELEVDVTRSPLQSDAELQIKNDFLFEKRIYILLNALRKHKFNK